MTALITAQRIGAGTRNFGPVQIPDRAKRIVFSFDISEMTDPSMAIGARFTIAVGARSYTAASFFGGGPIKTTRLDGTPRDLSVIPRSTDDFLLPPGRARTVSGTIAVMGAARLVDVSVDFV